MGFPTTYQCCTFLYNKDINFNRNLLVLACPRFPFMRAAILQFCAFLLFGANNSQTRKNDYASRFAEMEKNAHSVSLVQNLS